MLKAPNFDSCANIEAASYAAAIITYADGSTFDEEHYNDFVYLIAKFIITYPDRVDVDIDDENEFNAVIEQGFERACSDMVKEVLDKFVDNGFANRTEGDFYQISQLGKDVGDYI